MTTQPPPSSAVAYQPATAGGTGVLVTKHDGYEVWTALMDDAVDSGDIVYLPARTIAGYKIPPIYWNPAGHPHHPHVPLMNAMVVLASACSCRGRLHASCVYPTMQRGEPLDMPEDWHDWVEAQPAAEPDTELVAMALDENAQAGER